MARPKILEDVQRKMVSLPGGMAAAIEDFRFRERIKTEAEAIRQLIGRGLQAAEREKPKRG